MVPNPNDFDDSLTLSFGRIIAMKFGISHRAPKMYPTDFGDHDPLTFNLVSPTGQSIDLSVKYLNIYQMDGQQLTDNHGNISTNSLYPAQSSNMAALNF